MPNSKYDVDVLPDDQFSQTGVMTLFIADNQIGYLVRTKVFLKKKKTYASVKTYFFETLYIPVYKAP